MSQDNRNGMDIGPEWDKMDMDWLDGVGGKPPAERPRPVQTRREPARSRTWDEEPVRRRTPDEETRRNEQPRHAQQTRRTQEPAPRRTAAVEAPSYRRRDRGRKLSAPVILLVVLLVGGMIFAAWQLGSIFLNYHRDRSAYDDLASRAISGLAESEKTVQRDDEDEEEEEDFVSEVPIAVDWDYLRTVNDDIVGWLYCPDTVINYPVVQTSDNEFYLKHGFDKQTNVSGTLFSDITSVSGVTLSNYIIYGHNMKDKSMFGTYQGYVSENYYKDYPTMYFLTPEANYRVDLVCAHIVEGTMDNYPTYFSNAADYQTYLNTITSRAFWVNYDALTTDYQLLTMSTCTSASGYADARLLVQGMMVPIR